MGTDTGTVTPCTQPRTAPLRPASPARGSAASQAAAQAWEAGTTPRLWAPVARRCPLFLWSLNRPRRRVLRIIFTRMGVTVEGWRASRRSPLLLRLRTSRRAVRVDRVRRGDMRSLHLGTGMGRAALRGRRRVGGRMRKRERELDLVVSFPLFLSCLSRSRISSSPYLPPFSFLSHILVILYSASLSAFALCC